MNVLKKGKALLAGLLSATMIVSAFAGIGAVSVSAAEPGITETTTYFKAYPKAEYETTSPDYALTVNGQAVDTVAYFEYKDGVYRYSYAHLAYEGTATFEVKNLRGNIESYNLSPHSYELEATVSGDTLTFDMEQKDSRYVVLRTWVNGTRYELFIACDPEIDYGLEELKKGNFVDVVKDLKLDNTGATKLTTANGSNAQGPLQDAINDLSRQGGGTLYFPAGTYTFVYLDAKDNVTIFLDEGAYLRGTGDRTDYTWSDYGANGRQGRRLLHLRNAKNFALVGPGTIDGNIIALSYNSKNIEGVPSGPPTSSTWYPDGWNDFRTGIIDGNGAENITLKGITVKETTGWTFNICNSKNIDITNVKMLNDYEIVHSDGYDLVGCQDVVIDDCLGVCGDDVFCPKASDYGHPMENYLITDGVAYARGGAGCKVGVQASADTNNIVFDNIDVVQGYRAFCIAHDEGQGSWSNITFRNIRCEEIWIENTPAGGTGQYATAAFIIWTLGGGQGPVNNVTVENVTIENSKGQKATIQGNSAAGKLSNITIKNLVMDGITMNSNNYRTKINVGANVENFKIESDKLQLTETYVYEAEVSTDTQGGIKQIELESASGGYVVDGLSTTSEVNIKVYAEASGPREIELFYCSRGASQMAVSVNFADADVYDCTGVDQDVVSPNTIKFVADLNRGDNTITIKGAGTSARGLRLDKMEVAMLTVDQKASVDTTIATIDALPAENEVTADNAEAITEAINAYNALEDNQKVFVTNINKLYVSTNSLVKAGVTLPELNAIAANGIELSDEVIDLTPVEAADPNASDKDGSDSNGSVVWIVVAVVAVIAVAGVAAVVVITRKKKTAD